MQKDIHFYLTYALARKIRIDDQVAQKIAWADYFTDELTSTDLYGIQTQSDIIGNWSDRQIQHSVLIPFHFIPGRNQEYPWMTIENNSRARDLIESALKNADPLQLGIALHGLQDTFSHQSFSGWMEKLNNCYPWYYIQCAIPNVGHSEMHVIPDVVNYVWTDPRTGRRIDNKKRAMGAAKETFSFLLQFQGSGFNQNLWQNLKKELSKIFHLKSYDKRVDQLCKFSGTPDIDYKKIKEILLPHYRYDFIKAARNHLGEAMNSFKDIPPP